MIRKVWYMILVLITIYLEIMYDSTWMLAMLAFELLLAAVMFLMSWYLKCRYLQRNRRLRWSFI